MRRVPLHRLVPIAALIAFTAALLLAPALAVAVTDDDIPGVERILPFSYSDTLSALDADNPVDSEDVSKIYLAKGDTITATMTVADPENTWVGIDLFGPAATSIWGESDPVADADDNLVLHYTAPAAGYYYMDVWAMPPLDPQPEYDFPGYAGWAGAYSIDATVTHAVPTTIGIRTAATTAYWGKTVTLSGGITPLSIVGKNIVVYVKKPGSTRWTYSSNRTAYSLNGAAAWQYKYYFKPGMAKGYYVYKAVVPAWPGFLTSTSPNTVTIRLR